MICRNMRRFVPRVCNFGTDATSKEDKTNSEKQLVPIAKDERDYVNFPRPQRLECPGRVRYGIVPEEWFEFFYSRLGVTGPYSFALGLSTYLASKEIFVLEHNFYNGLSVAILCVATVKIVGPEVTKYADKEIDKYERGWKDSRISMIRELEEAVINEKVEQWRAEGQELLFEAKKQMVAVQLEADYRERVMEAYEGVLQRLEWEAEQARVARALNQKHMVMWVSQQVTDTVVSNRFEQTFLRYCITDLLSMASHFRVDPPRSSSGSGGVLRLGIHPSWSSTHFHVAPVRIICPLSTINPFNPIAWVSPLLLLLPQPQSFTSPPPVFLLLLLV